MFRVKVTLSTLMHVGSSKKICVQLLSWRSVLFTITPKNEGFGFPWYTKLPRLHVLISYLFAAVVSTKSLVRIYRLRDSNGDGKIDEHDVDTFANCCKNIPGCLKRGPGTPEKPSFRIFGTPKFGDTHKYTRIQVVFP